MMVVVASWWSGGIDVVVMVAGNRTVNGNRTSCSDIKTDGSCHSRVSVVTMTVGRNNSRCGQWVFVTMVIAAMETVVW